MAVSAFKSNRNESIGYAAADKAEDSHELLVYPPQMLPLLTGDVSALEIVNKIETTDGDNTYSTNINLTNVLVCTYGGGMSNRTFPPDIRKGEQVTIYNYGDTDTWYWEPQGRNDNLRRTETLRYHVSASLENAPVQTDDNTYYFEMDTRRNKRVVISTSNQLGETYRYLFEINPALDRVYLGDSANNFVMIESADKKVTLNNNSGSILVLDAENIDMSCSGNIRMKAGGTCTIYSGKDMTLQTSSNLKENISGDNTRTIGGNVTETTAGSITRVAGGAWSVSFGAGGTCMGTGSSSMTMYLNKLYIKRA